MMKHRLITLTAIFFAAILLTTQTVQAGELHKAAGAGDLQKVKLLLSQGADVNAKDKYQNTPLHEAVSEGNTEMAELLISKGANVNARDEYQNTLLHSAAVLGKVKMAELLIRKGADFNAKNKWKQTPLHVAAYKGKTEVAKLLISKGADVNARDKDQETPLHRAASKGKTEVAKLLISKGADVNARGKDQETPLHRAAWAGKTEVAELLIRKGADVNTKNKSQKTPLHTAALMGEIGVAELLIRNGADVNARDRRQYTPLHTAAHGEATVVELLLRSGADVNAKDNAGESAAKIAEDLNHPEIAALIRNLSGGSARSDLANLVRKIVKEGSIRKSDLYSDDWNLRLMRRRSNDISQVARLTRSLSPPPAIPQEAQNEMTKGSAIFKLAHQPKDFWKAAEHFEKAALLAPWWPAPYYNVAMAWEKQRSFEMAKWQYENYLIASPDAADAQAVKGKIAEMDLHIARAEQIDKHIKKANEYLANKDRTRAIEEIREAVRLEPDDGRNHYMLGHVLAYGDNPHSKEAITELEYAQRLGIKTIDLYWDLGISYQELDEYDAAIESYTKALASTIFGKEKKAKRSN